MIARYIGKKTSPIISIKIQLFLFIVINFVGFLTLTGPEVAYLVWIFAVLWGMMIGWYYPAELSIFSQLMPKGQESELAGFLLYCTNVLLWLPVLVFTLMNEAKGIHIKWAAVSLNVYFSLAFLMYQLMPAWSVCLDVVRGENRMLRNAAKERKEENEGGVNVTGGQKEEDTSFGEKNNEYDA